MIQRERKWTCSQVKRRVPRLIHVMFSLLVFLSAQRKCICASEIGFTLSSTWIITIVARFPDCCIRRAQKPLCIKADIVLSGCTPPSFKGHVYHYVWLLSRRSTQRWKSAVSQGVAQTIVRWTSVSEDVTGLPDLWPLNAGIPRSLLRHPWH